MENRAVSIAWGRVCEKCEKNTNTKLAVLYQKAQKNNPFSPNVMQKCEGQ